MTVTHNDNETILGRAEINDIDAILEIPVVDLDRAVDFYERVFLVELERDTIDGNDAAYFPAADGPID